MPLTHTFQSKLQSADNSDSNEGNLTDEIKRSQSKRRTKTPVLVSYATLISGVLLLFGTRFLVFQWHTLLNTGVRTNIFCCWYIIAVCHLKTIKKPTVVPVKVTCSVKLVAER